jgi:hypothetical protein
VLADELAMTLAPAPTATQTNATAPNFSRERFICDSFGSSGLFVPALRSSVPSESCRSAKGQLRVNPLLARGYRT